MDRWIGKGLPSRPMGIHPSFQQPKNLPWGSVENGPLGVYNIPNLGNMIPLIDEQLASQGKGNGNLGSYLNHEKPSMPLRLETVKYIEISWWVEIQSMILSSSKSNVAGNGKSPIFV